MEKAGCRTYAGSTEPRRRICDEVFPPSDVATARDDGSARIFDEAAHDEVRSRVLHGIVWHGVRIKKVATACTCNAQSAPWFP
jgi:hypothetical protein